MMELGRKIQQTRKMAGLTQEQLAEKLNVSRQTISKWEQGTSVPDLESMVAFCRLFQLSLDDFLLEKLPDQKTDEAKITLEDLMKMHLHNRRMTLLLTGGLIFLMVCVLVAAFVAAAASTTNSIEYMLYRYMVIGEYTYAPVNYVRLLYPAIGSGIIGIVLCSFYFVESRKGGTGKMKQWGKKWKIGIGVVAVVVLVALIFIVWRTAGSNRTYDSSVYDSVIADFPEDTHYAVIDTNGASPVLLSTELVYDYGNGIIAACDCNVFGIIDGEAVLLGCIGGIDGSGTAYPIMYDETGIYAAGPHSLARYQVDDKNGALVLEELMTEQFDERGNASYTREKNGEATAVTEEEFYQFFEIYGEGTVVDFQ